MRPAVSTATDIVESTRAELNDVYRQQVRSNDIEAEGLKPKTQYLIYGRPTDTIRVKSTY